MFAAIGVYRCGILELLAEESQLNVYAGEREARPPRAPTNQA
jgi:hypothetical protein